MSNTSDEKNFLDESEEASEEENEVSLESSQPGSPVKSLETESDDCLNYPETESVLQCHADSPYERYKLQSELTESDIQSRHVCFVDPADGAEGSNQRILHTEFKESANVFNEADDNFILEQIEKLVVRRKNKDHASRQRWLKFQREQKEAEEEEKQFKAYWVRRHMDDEDLWRDKDFANAIYKVSRTGYTGKRGKSEVPVETVQQMNALYMQATVGDYGDD